MEFTDRYQAMGMPYPDVATMCQGQCEGTGFVPVKNGDHSDPQLAAAWREQHAEAHTWRLALVHLWRAVTRLDRVYLRMAWERDLPCDGWHFVRCPACKGSGLRIPNDAHVGEETT